MAGDAPLLDRLARLPAVPAADAVALLERLAKPQADPVIGPLFGVDEEGDVGVRPLVPAGLPQPGGKKDPTGYAGPLRGPSGVREGPGPGAGGGRRGRGAPARVGSAAG